VLNNQDGDLALAARVKDPDSGRVMEVYTTQPGIQLYTGNFLSGNESEGGAKQHEAFCLETQHYPDSPNQKDFATAVLRPGETFKQTTVHKFFAE
jgi:aldose 1-epimerase